MKVYESRYKYWLICCYRSYQQKIKIIVEMRASMDLFTTPSKKDNEVFQSRFFPNSEKKIDNPEAYHTYFQKQPFEKFTKDISRLEPISNESPSKHLLNRNYVVIDEKVTYGKPLTLEQFQELVSKKQRDPEIVTWGFKDSSLLNLKINSVSREQVQIQKEGQQKGFMCCCAPAGNSNEVLVKDI